MQWQTNGVTWSEEWRNKCEARELLTWSLADRRKQLQLVYDKRGHKAWLKLTDEMTRQWKLTKNPQQQPESLSGKTQQPLEKPQQIDLI
jgi:hypothetical protein